MSDLFKDFVPCLSFVIDDIESQVKICRWDLVVHAAIRRLLLREMTQGIDGGPIELLSTPEDSHLLKVTYRQVGRLLRIARISTLKSSLINIVNLVFCIRGFTASMLYLSMVS